MTSGSNSGCNLLLHIVTQRGDGNMDIWTEAVRKSFQLDSFPG